jgi:hypothetical protein
MGTMGASAAMGTLGTMGASAAMGTLGTMGASAAMGRAEAFAMGFIHRLIICMANASALQRVHGPRCVHDARCVHGPRCVHGA